VILARRLYRDYLEPERLDDFHRVVQCARDHGYGTMTLSQFAEMATASEPTARSRTLLLRHDIDSDVARARRMREIERELGVVGSYFFRRSTWDVDFMRELSAAGCEVGYHYEELAALVKERGAATAAEARALIEPARARLRASLAELRASSGLALDVVAAGGLALEVVAAHGDFANRAVGVSSQELLADPAFRAEIGVRLEAYDVEPQVDARFSDGAQWCPHDPVEAFRRGERVVEVLVHPRPWGAAPAANARADLLRLGDECIYRLHRLRRRS
jgi:hypothetical protein